MSAKQFLTAALSYFALVFATGFVLGTLRVLVLVPQFGARAAELAEIPVMLLAAFFAARWIATHFSVPPTAQSRLGIGLLALTLLLAVEFSVVLWLQGISVRESIANRDPISGAAYAASLLLFAVMLLLVIQK